MSTRRTKTATEKANIVQYVLDLVAQGYTQNQACSHAGVLPGTFSKWKARLEANGGDIGALLPGKPTGRPVAVEFSDAEVAGLRRCRLENDSLQLAVEAFLRTEACRPTTAEALIGYLDRAAETGKREHWPESVRRAAYVTAAERAEWRGRKASQSCSVVERRAMTWRDETGQEWPMVAGTIYESDDMSSNEPFRYEDLELGRETVGRQTLLTNDVFSNRYLGATALGRRRDAYRVEDIADHLLDIVEAAGLPTIWRFERGVWNNNFIKGVPIPGEERRWGGLDALFRVAQKHTSRGKGGLENSFNQLQSLMAHQSTSIGRTRGEMQEGTKLFLKAQAGDPKALAYFWTLSEYGASLCDGMQAYNLRAKQRRAFGAERVVPEELWADRPSAPLPEAERWRFLPVKKRATVRQGVVETTVEHYARSFRFMVHGAEGLPTLDHGHAVLIAFHPGRPEEGCRIFNADRSARNREGFPFGHRLGVAEWMDDRPQEDFSGQGDYGRKKRASAAVRSEFRAIVPRGTGPGTLKSVARDGLGASLKLQRGGAAPGEDTHRLPGGDPAPATTRSARDTAAGVPCSPDRRAGGVPAAGSPERGDRLATAARQDDRDERLRRLRAAEEAAEEHL